MGNECMILIHETGKGDYSQERHVWLDELDIQMIADQVLAKREEESKPA